MNFGRWRVAANRLLTLNHRGHMTPAKRMKMNNPLTERPWVSRVSPAEGSFPNPGSASRGSVQISSYNILSQFYAATTRHLYQHLEGERESLLEWENRWPKIRNELENLASDILCLQEVDKVRYNEVIREFLLDLGYGSFFYQKTGGSLPDGTVIAYRKVKFCVAEDPSFVNFYDARRCASGQIALVVKLRHLESRKCFIIGGTHLVFNPHRGDWKIKQLIHLLAELSAVRQKMSDEDPVVFLCGDLNSEPESKVLEFLLKGETNLDSVTAREISKQGLDPEYDYYQRRHGHIGREPIRSDFLNGTKLTKKGVYGTEDTPLDSPNFISHTFNFKSAYDLADARRGRHATAISSLDYHYCDYILYTCGVAPRLVHALPQSTLPLPNEHFGSDHLSISAQFDIL